MMVLMMKKPPLMKPHLAVQNDEEEHTFDGAILLIHLHRSQIEEAAEIS